MYGILFPASFISLIWISVDFRLFINYLKKLTYVLRAISFGLIFLSNAFMWNFFVKSMNYASSIEAVVVNSTTNFFLSVPFLPSM